MRLCPITVVPLLFAGLASSQPAAGQATNPIDTITVNFTTTTDDREGGSVEVTLWQEGKLVGKLVNSERAWGDRSENKESVKNESREYSVDENKPIEARVKLKEGREVNIRWRFDVTVDAYDSFGNHYQGEKKRGVTLDTTGRGANRESEAKIGQLTKRPKPESRKASR